MVKKSIDRLIGAALAVFALATQAAEPLPASVRIASIATFTDGKSQITGGQTAIIAAQGILEAELKKRGVALQWVPVPVAVGGPVFNEALANGSTDFASYGDFPSIVGKAGGIDIKMIVPAGRGTNSYLIVPADSPARTLADLKGKRISIQRGRPLELPFSQLLRSQNLRYSDFRLLNVNSQAGAAALAARDLDGLFMGSEAWLLQDKGIGRIIWSSKNTPLKWRAELFVRREFAEKYPELTQLVATAYVRAAYWSSQEENRDKVIGITTRGVTPISVVQRDYEGEVWKDRWSPLFDEFTADHYREAIAFMREQNLIRRDFAIEDLFEPKFLNAALKELQLEHYWTPRRADVVAKAGAVPAR